MSRAINVRQIGSVVVLDVTGRLVFGEVDEMRDTISRLLEAGSRHFVLNLSRVSYMDSAGLGQTIAAYTSVTRRGGRVVLLNPSKQTNQLLQIAKLVTIFDVYADESEALNALMKDAAMGLPRT
jgi:anti-sigma B factor antagonist